jgi:DNA polymerase-1
MSIDSKEKIPRLFLIDGSALVYRAHFALIRNPLKRSDGMPTSAVFGFTNSLLKLLKKENPEYIAVVFDAPEKTFRHQMFPEYKATREKMPDEMIQQLPYVDRVVEALHIKMLRIPGYEADDVIGSLAKKAELQDMTAVMVTGDKDFMQLISDRIVMYKPSGKTGDVEIFTPEEVREKWGVTPAQMRDFLALMGDKTDNIPGVPGIGEMKAAKLIRLFGSLENILKSVDEIPDKNAKDGLQEVGNDVFLFRDLVTIRTDVPLDVDVDELKKREADYSSLVEIFKELEFKTLLDQIEDNSPFENRQKFIVIDSPGKLESFIQKLERAHQVAIDTETTSIDPFQGKLIGLSFSFENDKGYYIPLNFLEKSGSIFGNGDDVTEVLNRLRSFLEDPNLGKIGQNIKFDVHMLHRCGVQLQGITFDTMVAAYLLQPDNQSYKLDNLSLQYLNYRMIPIERLIGKKGKNQITMDKVPLEQIARYSAEDAIVTYKLAHVLMEQLDHAGLTRIFKDIEIPLIPVLCKMERNGVYLDIPYLQEMSHSLQKKLETIKEEIYDLAGR